MASGRARIVVGLGVLLVVLVAAAVLLLLRPSSKVTEGPGAGGTAIAGTSSAGSGVVYIDGQRVQPPFAVTSDGATVKVNGKAAAEFGARPVDDPRPTPAAGDDAFTIVSEVRRAYLDAGGGDKGVEAALALARTHPAKPKAQELGEPRRIEVTDAAGETGSFRVEVPDAVARKTDAARAAQRAKETAEEWSALLAGGGGVVASKSGVTLLLPADRVQAFVDALGVAQGKAGVAKDAALAELLQAPGLVEDFGGKAPALAPASASAIEGSQRGALPVALRVEGSRGGSAPAQGAGGRARTPGKAEAYLFSITELDDSDSRAFIKATQDEGYSVWVYRDPRNGFTAFTRTSNTGALYIVSHSSPSGVSVEKFPNAQGLRAMMQGLQAAGVPRRDMDWWNEAGGAFWLDITRAGIARYWRGPETIVHSASCQGESLHSAYRAREYFGYEPITSCSIATPDTRELWGRMSGVIGEGRYRYAAAAFSSGTYSAGFRYHDGSPEEDTALSPAVVRAEIPSLLVGEEGAVLIAFDTIMNTRVAADGVVAVLGCLNRAGPAQWQFDSLLSVPVAAREKGDATVTVSQALATSARAFIKLDGNANPKQSGVAPNRDDWTGAATCRESRVAATSTPTSVTARRGPQVTMLESKLAAPVTTYSVTASDPDKPNDPNALKYEWSMTGEACGTPRGPWKQSGATVRWSHSTDAPDRCAHEGTNHAVVVTVVVTSSNGATATCTLRGSEDQRVPNPPCVAGP